MTTPCDECRTRWRVALTDLCSGVVRAVPDYWVSFDIEELLNDPGRGSLSFACRDARVRDWFPGISGVFIEDLECGDVAFGGYVQSFQAGSNGVAQVGLASMETYLWRRHLDVQKVYTQQSQTVIAADLVTTVMASTTGPPITATALPSTQQRDRTYETWDVKVIGDAITELSQVVSGLDWTVEHTFAGGKYSTRVIFADEAGATTGLVLRSQDAADYRLDIDQTQQVTHVHAVGEGQEADQKVAIADAASCVRWDASPSWSDVSVQATLQQHADGWLDLYSEPVAVPSLTFTDCVPVNVGDRCTVQVCAGCATFDGAVRVIGRSVNVQPDERDRRTLSFSPLQGATTAVLNAEPCDPGCADCGGA